MTTDIIPWNSIATTYMRAYLRTRLAWETFSHAETDTWGTPETKPAGTWTTSGGVAANFYISDGTGKISLSTVNVSRFATTGSAIGDVDETISITVPAVAATDTYSVYFLLRFVDTSNYYSCRAVFDTGGTVDLIIARLLAGSSTTLGTANDQVAYSAGSTVKLRFQAYGTSLGAAIKGKIWLSTEDEPDEWTLDDIVDNTPELLRGGVGIRAILSAANTNTLPFAIEFDNFTAYSAPQWTDLTSYVTVAQGRIEGNVGRQTELSTIEPSNLAFQMKNQSGWFTPDNVLSPYYPDWQTGTPIRWSETIGARSFAFPDMWLEVPEVSVSFEASGDPTLSDRTLNLNCVDRITRMNRSGRFISNLATYIIGEATEGALRAYWPLVDAAGSTYATSAGPINQEPLRWSQVDSYQPISLVGHLLNFGTAAGPPGDDGTSVEFTPTLDSTQWGRLGNSAVTNCTPGSDFATLVCWVFVPEDVTTLDQIAFWRDLATTDIAILIDPLGGDEWMATFGDDTGSDTALTGGLIVPNRWHLLGGQIDFATGDIAFWVNDLAEVAGNTGGSGSGGLSLDRIVIDGSEDSAPGVRTAHVQCYIGDADAFTHEDFLAQYERGMLGWPTQRVDERIRMICTYAGIPDGLLDLEESDSLIQQPAFANQTPGDLVTTAAATGGGYLFTRADKLVYHDRKHRFGL